MGERILIAYASRSGSTKEVAEAMGDVMRGAGLKVDVKNVKEVQDLSDYSGVIIGSAARAGRLLGEARKFAVKFKKDIERIKTAYFTVCLTIKDDTPENRKQVDAYLDPLKKIKEPVCVGLFAGKFDVKDINSVLGFALKKAKVPEGDFRNWENIKAWSHEVTEKIKA